MKKANISNISFEQIDLVKDVEYSDDDIAILSDIRNLPFSELPLSLEMYGIITCERGKLQIEINDIVYTLTEKKILAFRSNEVVNSCMMSMDFSGKMLCFSSHIVIDTFSVSDLWDKGLFFMRNRITYIDENDFHLYNLYRELLKIKIERQMSLFKKEIVHSIVKAVIYDLLSYFKVDMPEYGKGLLKQSEVLFQRFISLISSQTIKPRKVAWYAGQLHITPKHLSTVCKHVSGKTAFEWINEYIQGDILILLKNTNKSIKEVANYLKFPSISFFGKYVKSHTGFSPTEYRKKLRDQVKGEIAE